jgi:DNA polymerase-1
MGFCDTGETEVHNLPEGMERLWQLLGNENIEKIAHNLKFEMHHCAVMGIRLRGQFHDTMIMHQLIDNQAFGQHGLDDIANEYGSPEDIKRWGNLDSDVKSAAFIYKDYSKIPSYIMTPYQHADAERTALIFGVMFPIIKRDPKLHKIYLNEIELIKTTVRIERRGIMLSKPHAIVLKEKLEKEVIEIENKWLPVNLNSPKQLIKVLFDEKKFPIIKRSPTGEPSTDAESIKILSEQFPDDKVLDDILKMRAYTKGKSTIQSYLEAADENGILHPNINTNHDRTGRESSSGPNMQNVSNEISHRAKYPIPARCCFRARPGYVLFGKDHSGIEMRIGVQGTGSKRLIKLVEEDFDFHDACAKNFYGDRYLKADKSEKKFLRGKAKNGARFPMFYGAGIDTISKGLGLSYEETKAGYARDKSEYPEFYDFMDECTKQAKRKGYVYDFFGRKLYTPPDRPYAGCDYAIQGTAAEVLKVNQVTVDKYLIKEDLDIHILLPVHDELVLEYPRALLINQKEILGTIDKLMTKIEEITVKLTIETEMSTFLWSQMKEYK